MSAVLNGIRDGDQRAHRKASPASESCGLCIDRRHELPSIPCRSHYGYGTTPVALKLQGRLPDARS